MTPHSAAATSDRYPGRCLPRSPSNGRTTAMVMLAENYQYVIGGDPDRDTIDLAVLDTATGRVRGHLADAADGAGYRRCSRGLPRTLRAGGSGHWKAPAASPPGCSCSSSTRVKRSSKSVHSSGPAERRTIASTPSALLARRCPATSRAHPDLAVYGKPCGWYSLAGKEFWSVAPRPSTNSRA